MSEEIGSEKSSDAIYSLNKGAIDCSQQLAQHGACELIGKFTNFTSLHIVYSASSVLGAIYARR
jgi:hypothetical protein